MSDPENESGYDLLMTLNTANCIKLIRLSKVLTQNRSGSRISDK